MHVAKNTWNENICGNEKDINFSTTSAILDGAKLPQYRVPESFVYALEIIDELTRKVMDVDEIHRHILV